MIDYGDGIAIICQLNGSVAPRAAVPASIGGILAVVWLFLDEWSPTLRQQSGLEQISSSSVVWNAMTAGIFIVLALRIKQALGRFWEGTTLLHQMRGEWFDAASCLFSFSRDAKVKHGRVDAVKQFRGTLVRLMSLMHGTALDTISSDNTDSFPVIDVQGLDTDTLVFLKSCQEFCSFSKVEALQHLIQVLVTDAHHAGVLTTPPPILSRIYQTLSRGFVNLLNARKIKDTSFPMPFVQTLKLTLFVHCMFTPLMITNLCTAKVWAALLTFIPVFVVYSLNLIAWELEMPFGTDANDLPLQQFQVEMNDTLLMLMEEACDHLPQLSPIAAVSLTRDYQDCFRSNSVYVHPLNSSRTFSVSSRSTWRSEKGCGSSKRGGSEETLDRLSSNSKALCGDDFLRKRSEQLTKRCSELQVATSRASGSVPPKGEESNLDRYRRLTSSSVKEQKEPLTDPDSFHNQTHETLASLSSELAAHFVILENYKKVFNDLRSILSDLENNTLHMANGQMAVFRRNVEHSQEVLSVLLPQTPRSALPVSDLRVDAGILDVLTPRSASGARVPISPRKPGNAEYRSLPPNLPQPTVGFDEPAATLDAIT